MMVASPEATQADFRQASESEDTFRGTLETPVEQPTNQPAVESQLEIKPAASPSWRSPLRIFEILTLFLALATGLAVIYLRRKGWD